MIPRLKGIIAHDHNAKFLGEDGEVTASSRGTRLSPKVKPFGEDPRDTSTRGWRNRPNHEKDLAPTCDWGNRPNPKKNLAKIKV